ncbi:hypothetical protein [Actinomadura harenae]|uniref:Fibronectin type-III domain-containing protein n=1 Tax=Actinomadura harenae TaxID=2483351 RepID=A0A3M2LLI2_9ACTN|nr:hypothetical protein [Actinomadura harenae]RMI37373.1 hypothetical protein EBO15_35995 [Actinomadura harenae]
MTTGARPSGTGFDAAYQREVLEPARAAGDQPPEDLRVRYALPDQPTPEAVAARVKQVRQCWRRARGQLKYRKLVDRLEAEHRELAPVFAAAERGDLNPLRQRLAGGQARSRRRLEVAGARLADAGGLIQMVTPGELEDIARTAGVTGAELSALAAGRIEVREPDALPAAPPYAAYPKVRESLDVLGRRNLADFLFGGRMGGPMRVLDAFAAPGRDGGPLVPSADAVAAVAAEWARRSRDTSTTHAQTVLAALRAGQGEDTGAHLTDLIRYDVVDRLRERLRQRASERALLRHATEELGVDASDARRLVFAVLREQAPAATGPPQPGPADRLRELLGAGEIYAAAEFARALTEPAPSAADGGQDGAQGGTRTSGRHAAAGSDLPEDVAVLAAEARHRVATATRLREAAADETDTDRAWRLLADALKLVRDLPGAADHQKRLPPKPVESLIATVHADPEPSVRLVWEASPSTAGEVLYHMVRRRDRPPHGPADGEPVPLTRDDDPPVNVHLYYAVIAVRGEAAAPPTVAGPILVRPEPREVELAPGDGTVTGRWRCPPEAARVAVFRAGRSGEQAVPAGREGFSERVPNGVTHHYRVCAVYLDDQGREVTTPGVRTSVTPSAPPEPVYDIAVDASAGDEDEILVRFERPGHGTPEIVLLDARPEWPRSAIVPVEDVRKASRRIPNAVTSDGILVKPGRGGWLLAVTAAEGTAAVGAHHRYVNLPPPRRLVAERRGGVVHVGFDWPDEVAEVELSWRIGVDAIATGRIEANLVSAGRIEAGRLPTAAPERVAVTRAAYEAQGGLRVEVPEAEPVELAVATVSTADEQRVVGTPVIVEVQARTLVRYELERTGPPWKRALTVRLSAERPLRVGSLELVLRRGRVMPHRPTDGETLGSWTQVPVPGELTVPLPRSAGEYWLRCFTDDTVVELTDPPVRHLHSPR